MAAVLMSGSGADRSGTTLPGSTLASWLKDDAQSDKLDLAGLLNVLDGNLCAEWYPGHRVRPCRSPCLDMSHTCQKAAVSYGIGVVDTPKRIVIMTTNHPEKLDPALYRPGRPTGSRLELMARTTYDKPGACRCV
jgi:hypothetical protein